MKNYVGKKFSRLLIVTDHGYYKGFRYISAMCDCGTVKRFYLSNLTTKKTRSCGCLHKEKTSAAKKTHGMYGKNIYLKWASMMSRCSNSRNNRYSQWGGRGITVCKRWKRFENFYKDMGDCPKGFTIERIDNNKGYNANNCMWASYKEQNRNKRNNVFIKYKGQKRCIAEWSEITGIPRQTISRRHGRNLPVSMVFSKKIINNWTGNITNHKLSSQVK